MHDLNELIDPADPFLRQPSFFLDEATGINDSGEIVADGVYTPTGSTQQVFEAFILTPEVPVAAPEPASLPLLTGGIVALLLLRRRKNTQPSR